MHLHDIGLLFKLTINRETEISKKKSIACKGALSKKGCQLQPIKKGEKKKRDQLCT